MAEKIDLGAEWQRQRALRVEWQDRFKELARAAQQLIDATNQPNGMVEAIERADRIVEARRAVIRALARPGAYAPPATEE